MIWSNRFVSKIALPGYFGNPHQTDPAMVTFQWFVARFYCFKKLNKSGFLDTVTFGAMNWQTQKLSGDPYYPNLPNHVWNRIP